MKICEIINVGTEILLGDIVNTDAQYISEKLASIGLTVYYQTVVGDNPERLKNALNIAIDRSDIVILSGGLGPTPDDLTKEICAGVMGCEMYLHTQSLERIKAYFALKNYDMPESNIKQAMMPKGAEILENDNGTAPGCAITKGDKCVVILPGPPRELKPMMDKATERILMRYSDSVLVSEFVHFIGLGESSLAEQASDLLELENPTVAPYAKDGECLLRITAKAKNKAEAGKLIAPVCEEIKKRFNKYIYSSDGTNLEQSVVELLKKNNMTVALAESCTGGLLAKRITDVSGASNVFHCGVVSYENNVKIKLLSVSKADIEEYTEVSEAVAKQMAENVRKIFGDNIGVGITGYAGPETEGYIYIAVSRDKKTEVELLKTGRNDRAYNRYIASNHALNMIRKAVIGSDNFE